MVQRGASIGKFLGWIYLDFLWQDMYEASLSRVQHIRSMIPTNAGLSEHCQSIASREIICAY